MFCQKICAHHHRHAPGDFAHRLEQRQTVADLNRFVGNGGHAGLQQRVGERFAGGEMKIGEKNLSFSQKRKFGRKRLLHFDDHVGPRENIFGQIDNLRAGLFIFLVRITGANAAVFFHQHGVSAFRQLLRGRRDERDAPFLFFNFLRDADDHSASDK